MALSNDNDLEMRRQAPRSLAQESLLREYRIDTEIGRGSFGVVSSCVSLATGVSFAVKFIDKTHLSGFNRQLIQFEPKLSLLASSVPNTVRTHAVFEDASTLYIVMDLCPGPDLFDRLITHGPLSEPEAAGKLGSLMTAVAALHRRGMVHRDIKPENILFDADGQLRLADFGGAVCLEDGKLIRGIVGTSFYTAPEVLMGRDYGEKVDVWSAGVVLYVMLSGAQPFWGKTAKELYESVIRADIIFPMIYFKNVSAAAKHLIRRMLCKNVSSRLSAQEVLKHHWLSVQCC